MAAFVAGFSSILTGFNFIVTVHRMRAPGLTWFRLPLFVWAQYATSLVMILGTPVIAITLVLVMAERTLGLAGLRSEDRRRPGALPAPVLVLLAPGRLHHDPAGHGRRQRARRGRLAQAGLRLLVRRVLEPRDRDPRLPRVGPPPVREQPVDLRGPRVLDHHDARRRAVGREDVQLGRDDVQGLGHAGSRRPTGSSASWACS